MKRMLLLSGLLLLSGCDMTKPEAKQLTIETPDGTIEATQTQVDAIPQAIAPVTGSDLDSLTTNAPDSTEFIGSYTSFDDTPSLKDCDAAFTAWKSDSSGKFSDANVVRAVGCFLGNRCIADFDMEWVTVSDEYGTDYAVRSSNSEVMIFPFSSVQKRIDDGEHDFVHGIYYSLKNLLASGDYKPRQSPGGG